MAGDSTVTTASLQIQSNGCFANTKVLDFEGFTKSPLSQLTSFPSESQVVTLGLSQQCTGVSLCGTYTIAGGCADTATGSIVGCCCTANWLERLSTASSARSRTQNYDQSILARNGPGQLSSLRLNDLHWAFLRYVRLDRFDAEFPLWKSLHLVSTTNAAVNPQLIIDANINPTATTLTLNPIASANSCFESLNGISLSKT